MDTVANFLSQIKNACLANHKQVVTEHSKLREALGQLLVDLGYLKSIKVEKIDKVKKKLVVDLAYSSAGQPMITKIKRISKPGCRVYTTADKIPVTLGGIGTTILSTSQGLSDGKKAREKNLGGEIICQIY